MRSLEQVTFSGKYTFRQANVDDGHAAWRLVKAAGTLDLNSAYFYVLLCNDFSDTCLIAECEGEPVGVIIGYQPPTDRNTVFCWQVGVAPTHRGKGLALQMLKAWLELPANRSVRSVTATVSPDNEASRRLFCRLAADLNTQCEVSEHFTEKHFPVGHAPEPLYRIGPIDRLPMRLSETADVVASRISPADDTRRSRSDKDEYFRTTRV
jgi:L-2,4-diaminobutyric acid acetyltransferase